jgi:predicted N-formylglutamate amidohydrolase
MDMAPQPIGIVLAAGDPPPVTLQNLAGTSPFLLLGDHAGCAIPTPLGALGLPESERRRHISRRDWMRPGCRSIIRGW